eukprot:NODE_550_length_6834_cov_0.214402.p2 type:complete len:310 gc:universal NODE_550_length_6834_cov_0.214402:6421-5492(-)
MILFKLLFSNEVFDNCVKIYGTKDYIQVLNAYGNQKHVIIAKKLRCDKLNSFWLNKLNQYVGLANGHVEKRTMAHRFGYFGTSAISDSKVQLLVDGYEHQFISDTNGEVHAISNMAPSQVSSADSYQQPYHLNKPILVISDVDDTIKVSNVTNKILAIRRLFIEDFRPFDDIVTKYKEWNDMASFVYLSAGFRQSFQFIVPEILKYFPHGPLILRDVFSISALKFKIRKGIELLEITDSKAVLVGDSTEVDAQVYATLYHQFPYRICKIFIRLIDDRELSKVYQALNGIPIDIAMIFSDASSLPSKFNC